MTVSVFAAFLDSGRLERGHPVRDRLDAGQGDRAAGERLEQQEQGQRLRRRRDEDVRLLDRLTVPLDDVEHADGDHEQRQAHEQVGRDGEDVARLAQAAQVADRDQRDRDDADLDRTS